MWLDDSQWLEKRDLVLDQPCVNTPGALGFTPDQRTMPFLARLGAFITNPISRSPRQPTANRACLPFSGGFLLHTGLPNPGVTRAIRLFKHGWAGAPLPIIVHLLADSPESIAEMVRKLEGLENVLAVELGIHPAAEPETLEKILQAAYGELPIILCLSPEQLPLLLNPVRALQPAAVHLMPPRGVLPDPRGTLIAGRLYGPATLPLVFAAARTLVTAQVPVIAGGGICTGAQAQAFLDLGVKAISLGSGLWGVDPEAIFPDSENENLDHCSHEG